MQSTATPGLDNSLPTDDEELMEISETEELVTKEYLADTCSTKVCMHVQCSSSRNDVHVHYMCIAERILGLKPACLVVGLGCLYDIQCACTFVAMALLYIFFRLFVY